MPKMNFKVAKRVIDEAAIGEKLRKPIGRRVHFIYPKGEQRKIEILKDRCVMRSNAACPDEVPYWNVVDLIQFEDKKTPWLRFGYYRMAKDTPLWASRTTLCDRLDTWVELMVKAAREMPWFRELLERVMKRAATGTMKTFHSCITRNSSSSDRPRSNQKAGRQEFFQR